ncbi:MAG: hypothetical protein ACRDA3_14680 [Peptostreptococcaceae bacterium]
MSLETPFKYKFNVECPKCNHKYDYDVSLDCLKKVSCKDVKTQYEFLAFVVCKNPVCNYDIELKGHVLEYPEGSLDAVDLFKVK